MFKYKIQNTFLNVSDILLKYVTSSLYLFKKQFHKNITADNTRTGPTRLAKHLQWPQ